MSVSLNILQANHGDAFIFNCKKNDSTFIIVVDSGPKISSAKVLPIIKKLPKIDLLILSHYDEDHIAGFIEYLKKYPDDALKIKEYWCNCANEIEVKLNNTINAYSNAKTFADLLRVISGMNSQIKWIELIKAGHLYHNQFIDIEVIAPSDTSLALNRKKYITSEYSPITYANRQNDLNTSLRELAKRSTPVSTQVVNNASIAFILKASEKSFLMLGDVKPDDLCDYLLNKGYSKDSPLEVDFTKVAHHGSKYNISNEFLDIVKCNNYIISTNGGRGKAIHPDRETIAKLLFHPQRNMDETIHLYFNYNLEELRKHGVNIFRDGEIEQANCVIHEEELIL